LGLHLERLRASARNSGFDIWYSNGQLIGLIETLLAACGSATGNIEVFVNYQADACPHRRNLLAYYIPHKYPENIEYQNGIKLVYYLSERANPTIKAKNLPLKEAAAIIMEKQHAYEVLLVDKQGNITEGSRSNVFFVKEDTVFTAPLKKVLPGITRAVVSMLCQKIGIEIVETAVHHESIQDYEAAFLTGTSPGVLPIANIENHGFNVKNTIIERIQKAYNEYVNHSLEHWATEKSKYM
jgi:branched-chain amino acid aminotransferase